MFLQEFIDRTGYTPASEEECREIESQYFHYSNNIHHYPGNIGEFCEYWRRTYLPRKVEGVIHTFKTVAETEEFVIKCIQTNQVFRTVGIYTVMVW